MTHPELDAAAERAAAVLPSAIAERVADHLLDEACRRTNDLRELRMIADEVMALPPVDEDLHSVWRKFGTAVIARDDARTEARTLRESLRQANARIGQLERDVVGFRWTDPATGEVRTIAPADMEVMVRSPIEPRPDAVLPTTREALAEFFGGIRLAGSGAVVTGIFVQTALDVIAANGEQAVPAGSTDPADWQCGKCEGANVPEHFRLCPKRNQAPAALESLAAFFGALPKFATEALAAEQIDDATARRVINRMIYGNPTPEDEVPGA